MAKAQYTGVGGVARKAKALFLGVGGVARKVKAGYVGVGGVARQFADGGAVIVTGSGSIHYGNTSCSYGRSVDMSKVKRIHGYVCFSATTLGIGWDLEVGNMTCPDWNLYFDLTPDQNYYDLDESDWDCIEGSEKATGATLWLSFGNDSFSVSLTVDSDSGSTDFPGQVYHYNDGSDYWEDRYQDIDYSITFEMG